MSDHINTINKRSVAEPPRTPAQVFALIAGLFLLALGVLSLIFASVQFGAVGPGAEADDFLIWEASGWLAILWIVMGGLGVVMAARIDSARAYALIAGLLFAAMAVWGFINGHDVAAIFAAGTTDNITHAVLGGLGLAVAVLPERVQREGGIGTSPADGLDDRHGRFARPPRAAGTRRRPHVGS